MANRIEVLTLDVKASHANNPGCPSRIAPTPDGQNWYCVDCGTYILKKRIVSGQEAEPERNFLSADLVDEPGLEALRRNERFTGQPVFLDGFVAEDVSKDTVVFDKGTEHRIKHPPHWVARAARVGVQVSGDLGAPDQVERLFDGSRSIVVFDANGQVIYTYRNVVVCDYTVYQCGNFIVLLNPAFVLKAVE